MIRRDELLSAACSDPLSPRNMGKGWLVAVVFLLVTGCVAIAFLTRGFDGADALPIPQKKAAVTLGGSDAPARVAAFAWLRPQGGVLVIAGPATDFGYRIDHLDVKEGDMVQAGQPLAELDVRRERAAALAVSVAQVEEAKINVEYTLRQLRRKQTLFDTKSAPVSVQDLDTARENAQLALAKAETAKWQQNNAQVMLDQATIRAPSPGMVLRILKQEGEGFTPGQGLIELGQVMHMEAVAEVFETDVRFVKPGQEAVYSSPALSHPIKGKVLYILPKTDRVSLYLTNAAEDTEARIVRVVIALCDEPDVRRLTGLQGTVSIVTIAGS